jgi:hypothetical protein
MIDTHQEHQQAARQLWSGTVQHLFQTLDLDTRASAGEVSESLAVFCQEQTSVNTRGLSLLAARSFCAVGDCEAATRVLRHDRAHRAHAGSWLDALSAETSFPELYPLFSARALRPLWLNSTGAVWVLDFNRIHLSDADRHELILFQTVRVLTEKVFNVWKRSVAPGTLCVKGIGRLARFLRPQGAQAADQLLDHLCDVLARQAEKHGGCAAPAVLLLDL